MLHLAQIAETHAYQYPVEHAERARRTQLALLLKAARRPATEAAAPTPKRSLVPRIAGALGLF